MIVFFLFLFSIVLDLRRNWVGVSRRSTIAEEKTKKRRERERKRKHQRTGRINDLVLSIILFITL